MQPAHRIERTRNRHSRAILDGETIVVRLARGLSATEEHKHIEYLLRSMAKAAARELAKASPHPFTALLAGDAEAWIRPAIAPPCHITLRSGSKRTRAQRTATGWQVSVGPGTDRSDLHRFLWSLLSAWCQAAIEESVDAINTNTLCVRVARVRCRYMRTQWGSCSRDGTICINAALLLLPPHLLRYVIIHELAHRRHRNHSASFWAEVRRYCPEVAANRRELRNFRLPRL